MPPRSPDADALAAAYRTARYSARLPGGDCAIAVGARAPAVEAAIDAECFACITAWNPLSTPRDDAANRDADGWLVAQLDALGVRRWPMLASDVHGDHAEPGWLLAGIDRGDLDRLARAFGQAGTLYWRRGEAVRLRMYLAEPSGARPDATDWLE